MAYQADEILILKDDELVLLLAAAGISTWYGIEYDSVSKLENDRNFNKNLASLYRKDVIDWKNGKACIPDTYRHLLSILKASRICITIEREDRPGYVKGCYFSNGNVVSVERRTAADDEIELSILQYREWLEELNNNGTFPETAGIPEPDEQTDAAGELISHIELRSASDGRLSEILNIYEKGVYAVIERVTGNRKKTDYFTKESFTDLMDDMIGGYE